MKTTDGEIMQTTDEIQAAKTPYQHAKEALEMIRQDRDRWYRKSAEVMDECLALHKQIDDLTPKRAGDIYLSAVEFEELRHHMETGPVHDDHCVSKAGRDSLLEQRLLARIVMRGDDGCCAVTMLGQDVYRMLMCEVNHE